MSTSGYVKSLHVHVKCPQNRAIVSSEAFFFFFLIILSGSRTWGNITLGLLLCQPISIFSGFCEVFFFFLNMDWTISVFITNWDLTQTSFNILSCTENFMEVAWNHYFSMSLLCTVLVRCLFVIMLAFGQNDRLLLSKIFYKILSFDSYRFEEMYYVRIKFILAALVPLI